MARKNAATNENPARRASERFFPVLFKVLCVLALAATMLCTMLYNGSIWFVNPERLGYTVKGVDVSRYQGDIRWEELAGQGIRFAFIKATEGSGHLDGYFHQNFRGARDAGIKAGAYHFFSFESPGKTQAENFIAQVPVQPDSLPPVLDVELYGSFVRNPPDAERVRGELDNFIELVERHYGVSPILYSTQRDFARYIAGYFPGCPLWMRNVLREPKLADGRAFTFWQYSHRGWLQGYGGEEFFIDLNVYAGSEEDFSVQFG